MNGGENTQLVHCKQVDRLERPIPVPQRLAELFQLLSVSLQLGFRHECSTLIKNSRSNVVLPHPLQHKHVHAHNTSD